MKIYVCVCGFKLQLKEKYRKWGISKMMVEAYALHRVVHMLVPRPTLWEEHWNNEKKWGLTGMDEGSLILQ